MDTLKESLRDALNVANRSLPMPDRMGINVINNVVDEYMVIAHKNIINTALGYENWLDDTTSIDNDKFIVQLKMRGIKPKYMGLHNHTDVMNTATNYPNYHIYQIVFEDRNQKLIFEYTGDEYQRLEDELYKLYPGASITQSRHDIVVGKAYANYKLMVEEFDIMKYNLSLVDERLSRQCIQKGLHDIAGSDKRAICSLVEPNMNAYKSMKITIEHMELNMVINIGNGNITNFNKPVKTREQTHTEWIRNNPPGVDEPSSKYRERLSLSVDNPYCSRQLAPILRSMGYDRDKRKNNMYWIKATV